jgi:cytochrome o ubiquinol oxidase subunit 1
VLRLGLAHLVDGRASFIAMIVTLIVRSYDEDVDYYVSSEEVARTEAANLAKLKEVRA